MTDPWYTHPFVVIDFETTGLSAADDGICEMAAIRFESGKVTADFNTLVHPGCPIPESATKINGVTDDMVRCCPPILDAMTQLRATKLHVGAWPVAYNAPFDKAFWFAHSPTTKLEELPILDPDATWLDPLVMIRDIDKYVGGRGRHKLTTTCERWEVKLENAHRAAGDAMATGKLLWAMKERLGDVSLDALLKKQEARRAAQERERKEYKKGQKKAS